MTTLSERYVLAATRFVQAADERRELELELRERIEDTVDGLRTDGVTPEEAERAALVQLGDPLRLSAEYRQRPMHLIGPRFFYTWLRVVVVVAATAGPIVGLITALSEISAGGAVGETIVAGFGSALSVATGAAFWVTLFFAVAERVAPQVSEAAWTPEMLPQLPTGTGTGASRRTDMIASLVSIAVVTVLLLWQQIGSPFLDDGVRVPVLDPALWVPWLLLLVALLVASGLHAVWLYRSGWTWAVATVNAVVGVAFAAVVVPLLLQERLLNPRLVELLGWSGQLTTGLRIAAASIVAITLWGVVAGFVKAARGRRS
jgi:hypothetical protein